MTTNLMAMSLLTAGVLSVFLILPPFLLCLLLLNGWLGASVSAYVVRRRPDYERLTEVEVAVKDIFELIHPYHVLSALS